MTKYSISEKGLFKGVEIGTDKIVLSHLQYADDTIFIGEWSRANVLSLRNLLSCFEWASGLKVNFHKNCLYGIGVSHDDVALMANRLGCQVGSLPFTYLGIELEENLGIDFKSSFIRNIGNGRSTLFWEERWCGGIKLRELFPRLYRLEINKEAVIADRVHFSSRSLQYNWEWRRNPSGRTSGELESLQAMLSQFQFDGNRPDGWTWSLGSNSSLSVKQLTRIIDEKYFADLHSVRCPLCDDDLESVGHSLIFCKDAMEIWDKVFAWWGLGNMSNLSLNEICRDNCSASMTKFGKKLE
ncbi:uncharacterized protein [Rutidosis leptorrhynchoides]|uniref:uncharacterized protein n=1 Tax=Rutidosis leptorrhynchoides TaxID=125765 RepID=UPI003A991434